MKNFPDDIRKKLIAVGKLGECTALFGKLVDGEMNAQDARKRAVKELASSVYEDCYGKRAAASDGVLDASAAILIDDGVKDADGAIDSDGSCDNKRDLSASKCQNAVFSYTEIVRWAFVNSRSEKVRRSKAPNDEAWCLMEAFKDNPEYALDIYKQVVAAKVKKEEIEEVSNDLRWDGKEEYDILAGLDPYLQKEVVS